MATLYADYEIKQAVGYGDAPTSITWDHAVQRVTLDQKVVLKSVFAYYIGKSDTNAALHVFNLFRVSDGALLYSQNLWLTEVTGWTEYQVNTPPVMEAGVEYAVGFYVPSVYGTYLARDTTGSASYQTGVPNPSGVGSSWWGAVHYITTDSNNGAIMPTVSTSDSLAIKLGVSLNELPTAPTNLASGQKELTNLVPNPSFETDPGGLQWNAVTGSRVSTWAKAGSYSLEVIPTGASADSFIAMQDALSVYGLEVGKTYTASGTIQVPAVQAQAVDTRARGISAWTQAAGGAYTFFGSSPQTPNAVGVYDCALTFTIPSDAVSILVRWYNGSALSTDIVRWDALMLTESPAPQTYFDGSTTDTASNAYAWTGTPHLSPSLKLKKNVQNPADVKVLWTHNDPDGNPQSKYLYRYRRTS